MTEAFPLRAESQHVVQALPEEPPLRGGFSQAKQHDRRNTSLILNDQADEGLVIHRGNCIRDFIEVTPIRSIGS